jgi:hypothetical protein
VHEALERLRWTVAQLGSAGTARGLARIAHDQVQRYVQTGDRDKAAEFARTF